MISISYLLYGLIYVSISCFDDVNHTISRSQPVEEEVWEVEEGARDQEEAQQDWMFMHPLFLRTTMWTNNKKQR